MLQIYIMSKKRVIILILLIGVLFSFLNIHCYSEVKENSVNIEITEFNSLIRAGDSIVWKNGAVAGSTFRALWGR